MRFGIGEDGEHTLREISDAFGVSKDYIRQIEYKALGKLRSTEGKVKEQLEEAAGNSW